VLRHRRSADRQVSGQFTDCQWPVGKAFHD